MRRESDSGEAQTIHDFGVQWQKFRNLDEGYYASLDLLRDVFGPLVSVEDLHHSRVAEVGSGTGRIVRMLLAAGAARVWALEPSAAFEVLRDNLGEEERVTLLNRSGDQLPAGLDLDLVFVIGVLHHIPHPQPVLRAAREALRPGGRILIWVYGREGNGLYLTFVVPLRFLTSKLSHAVLIGVVHVLDVVLRAYFALSRRFRVPGHRYLRKVFGPLTPQQRRLVIYDQLNPAYARYYRREELKELLSSAGFHEVRLYHRHGYSWTACARKKP